jgi:LysR family nod box-dependent transcriptional activator
LHFKKLDLNLVIALHAIISELSVTRAAERLHMSQPAVSGVLAKLRRYFNDKLVVPHGRGIALTPFAEALRAPLQEFIDIAQKIVDVEPGFEPAVATRRFSIIASDVVMAVLLPSVVRHVAEVAPHVSIEVFEPQRQRLLDELEHGDIDLLIIPKEYASNLLPSETLYEDTYSCVIWAGNTAIGDELTIDQYVAQRHVSMNFSRARDSGLIGAANEMAKIAPESNVLVPFFGLGPELVIGTNYLCVVPTRLAKLRARYLPLRMLSPPIEFPPIVEVIQWQEHRYSDTGLAWLRSILHTVANLSCSSAPLVESLQPQK